MRLSALRTAAVCVLVLSGCTEKILSPDGTAASVVLAPPDGTFIVGDTLRLVATVLDGGGQQLTYRNIVWASSDPSVATVTSGLVTGVGRGPVTIYASAEALVDSAVLTVVQPFQAQQIAAGPGHSCAVTAAGDAYCWGESWGGKLGNGIGYGSVLRPSLVAGGLHWATVTIAAPASDYSGFTCGVSTGGAAYCWGNNYGEVFGSYSPEHAYVPLLLPDTGTASSVVASGAYSCVFGMNRATCFGAYTSYIVARTYSSTTPLQSLTTGGDHLCWLTVGGIAYCWGENASGQLGNSFTESEIWPVAVFGGKVFSSIDGGRNSTCAVDNGGGGWCWGGNAEGQLGDGTLVNRTIPTLVSGGIIFRMISTGEAHTCGVSTDGIGYCWGRNGSGQLGDGTLEDRIVPVEVAGGFRFESISAGVAHSCGITEGGAAYCWGSNGTGQLGDETNVDRLTPVAVWAP